jgi:hypothetical protein
MVKSIIKQEGFAIFLGPGPDDDLEAPDQMHAG